MRPNHFLLTAAGLLLALVARAEDAFSRARKEGKLVFVYRMLGDLDGLT
jgi:hypothetical protein